MKLTKFLSRNYRQYRDVEVDFPQGENIVIFRGENGVGKSNFLNAVSWCLYATEPHLSGDNDNLPVMNTKTIEESIGNKEEIFVELWFNNNEETLIFSRKRQCIVHSKQKIDIDKERFSLRIMKHSGTEIYEEDTASAFLERIFPYELRELFFFDGERLRNYFKGLTGATVKNSILRLAQVDVLDEVFDRLRKTKQEYQSEVGQLNPQAEAVATELENVNKMVEASEERIAQAQSIIESCDEKLEKISEKLLGTKDVEELEKSMQNYIQQKKKDEDELKELFSKKAGLLFFLVRCHYLMEPLEKSVKAVNAKIESQELPPPVDKTHLESIIYKKRCICLREVGDDELKALNELLDRIKFTTADIQSVIRHNSKVELILGQYEASLETNRKLTEDISKKEKSISEIEAKIKSIEKELSGQNRDEIRQLQQERERLKHQRDVSIGNKRVAEGDLSRHAEEGDRLEKELKKHVEKEGKAAAFGKKIEFVEEAMVVCRAAKEKIMDDLKVRINCSTEARFKDLIWKKHTYDRVEIMEDYSLQLFSHEGYSCMGSLSAGEMQILALSFLFALHEAAGLGDSPVLIDYPVGRISTTHRSSLAGAFTEIASEKQIVFFMLPDEYSEEISSVFQAANLGSLFELSLSDDDKEIYIRGGL